jgi:TolB-like protein
MKKLLLALITIGLVFGFSGCSKNRAYKTWSSDPYVQDTFNESMNNIADQLLEKNRVKVGESIAITSFVNLHKLNKTTYFGRKLSESMFNELYKRGFEVTDIRGSKNIRINANGEFLITRDIKLLRGKKVQNTYVLVGTYSKFGKGILVNARIIDNITGYVVATARTIIQTNACDIYENCTPSKPTPKPTHVVVPPKRTISITDAGCAYVDCPTNCYDGDCDIFIKPTLKKQPKGCSK